MSEEEILEAVRTIKEVCSDYEGSCNNCPYGTENNGCNITSDTNPADWEIVKPQSFKAFL